MSSSSDSLHLSGDDLPDLGMPEKRVVVATRNQGKLAEIREALPFPHWRFISAADLGDWPEPDETGDTFAANARIKALVAHERFALASLADDSGLVVDALDGAPGVRSSRYAGETASDSDNNRLLLSGLADVPAERRTARFRCVMVFIDEDGSAVVATGACEGVIGTEPRGEGGFGYDPLFRPNATPGRTMAELSTAEKNGISHRGAALRALREELLTR